MNIKDLVVSILAGTLFGFGLSYSQMINPARVIGFLDVAGEWDPTLLFVMAGALCVTIPFYRLIMTRTRPLFNATFTLPVKTKIDKKLVAGSILFGIGWGLAGLCPGPALTTLVSGNLSVLVFVVAMFIGFICNNLIVK